MVEFNHTENFMLNTPLIQDVMALRIVGTEAYTSGWIDRVVANPFPVVTDNGATRGNGAGRSGGRELQEFKRGSAI